MRLDAIIEDLARYAPDQTVYVQADVAIEPSTLAMIAWPPRQGSDRVPGMVPLIDVWHAREVIAEFEARSVKAQTLAIIDAVRNSGSQQVLT